MVTPLHRVDVYRARASSAYLWLASHDPVLEACQLIAKLDGLVESEPELKVVLID